MMDRNYLFHFYFSKFHFRYIWDGTIFNIEWDYDKGLNLNLLGLEFSTNPYVGWFSRGFGKC